MSGEPDFSQIPQGGLLQRIETGAIPAPPSAAAPGLHLLVNCLYDESLAALSAKQALGQARDDTLSILRLSAGKPWLRTYRSLWIRFFLPRNPDRAEGWAPKGMRRLYAYSIEVEGLTNRDSSLDMQYLLENPYRIESSEVEGIENLLCGENAE